MAGIFCRQKMSADSSQFSIAENIMFRERGADKKALCRLEEMREDAYEWGRGVNKRKMYVFQEVPFASPDFCIRDKILFSDTK